jgi:hypothetical protein
MIKSVTHAHQDDHDVMIAAMRRIVEELQTTLDETALIRRHAQDALRTTRLELARLTATSATTTSPTRVH